ncbi:unnamed protein product [Didymodactylos carnosus]|uniref:F-box domain-containing protein n=1 Tax=Didymodactylos carnosus TaxID=1234261 RepID=A0A816FY99_9BILA|nr:unnamed protein product [Didymodactylos carnosus]CAF4631692.1 unnamed protein product [Didymodactylos carnosus]
MFNSYIGLNDFPDGTLLIILKTLNDIQVFYSLHGADQRLNKIIQDPIFTSHLTFVKLLSDNFIDLISSNNMLLNRFCLQILPEIYDKIKWLDLDLESSFMKLILRAIDYPNLDTLGLYNIDEKSAPDLFTDR